MEQYKLIRGGYQDLSEIENTVNFYISKGYKPVGQLLVVEPTASTPLFFLQQMELQ